MRMDVNVHLLLLGEPDPGKIIRFEGLHLRYLNPDERSSGSLIQKALKKDATEQDIRSTPGIWIRRGDLSFLLSKFEGRTLFYLREDIMSWIELKRKEGSRPEKSNAGLRIKLKSLNLF